MLLLPFLYLCNDRINKRASLVLMISAILVFGSTVGAQTEKLSETEYTATLTEALDVASSRDRRISTEEVFYTGAQVTGKRQIVSDFVGNDAKKIEVVEDFNGKKTRSNSITLNGQFFCKDGERAWKRADKECARAGKMMAIPDGDYEYFAEPDPSNYGRKIYARRAKFVDSGSPEREAVRMKFVEIKFTTDETGAITEYTETRRGGIEPNGWRSTQVTKYIYEPADLKITDPTKGH